MKMKANLLLFALTLFVPLQTAYGGTFYPLDFNQLVARTHLAIEATVIDIQVIEDGFSQPAGPAKESTTPLEETALDQQDVETVADSANQDPLSLPAPETVPVEIGHMLFTDVTLAVDQEVFGEVASDEITIRLAGGSNGQVRVVVEGIPQLELNKSYLLFLRPDFENYADPITGVDQGFFQIVPSPDGVQDLLLNAEGDIVTGVQNGRIVVRYNPEESGGRAPQLVPPPEPDSGVVPSVGASLEATSFWTSQAPAMQVDDFIAQVRAVKGGVQ